VSGDANLLEGARRRGSASVPLPTPTQRRSKDPKPLMLASDQRCMTIEFTFDGSWCGSPSPAPRTGAGTSSPA
jgi:hypothetical protein